MANGRMLESYLDRSGAGVSVSLDEGVACLGGCDTKRCYAECFVLLWRNGKLETESLPKLPTPCANSVGVLFNGKIYVAGGIDRPDAASTLKSFYSLDLKNLPAGWHELDPWPGTGRMLATIGALDGSIYLFGGADLKPGAGDNAKPERVWLRDAFRYEVGGKWRRIADLPRVAVAAPSPAPTLGQSQLLVLGGDDGAQVNAPPQSHRGFRRDVLAYHAMANTWTTAGELPFSLVTTPAVVWHDRIVVPSGEARPGVRSNQVWAAEITARQ